MNESSRAEPRGIAPRRPLKYAGSVAEMHDPEVDATDVYYLEDEDWIHASTRSLSAAYCDEDVAYEQLAAPPLNQSPE